MGFSANGLRMISDGWLRFFQPGLSCWLRLQVFDPSSTDFAQLGFIPTVTGAVSGVMDIPVQPPADVKEISLHNIGMSGGKLRFGAREFVVSHTFVAQQMQACGYTDPMQVFNDPAVLGLYYDSRIFSIESITHEDFGGDYVLWHLLCNASEVTSPASS